MNLAQRFTLLVKGRLNAVLDSLEDPERSLNQLVLDMEEELDCAKRSLARALANEDRLRARITFHAEDAAEWQRAAARAMGKGREEDARAALLRVELAERQRAKLSAELARQSQESTEVRESISQMQDRTLEARGRLELVQAQMRQLEARRATGRILRAAESWGRLSEFDRISGRIEEAAATERNYQKLDDQLSGGDLRRRLEEDAVADAVADRLARLKAAAAHPAGGSASGPAGADNGAEGARPVGDEPPAEGLS